MLSLPFQACVVCPDFEGILPKGPYLPCISMAGRAFLAGYHRFVQTFYIADDYKVRKISTSCVTYFFYEFVVPYFHYLMDLYIFQMYIYQSQYEYEKLSYWLYFPNFLSRPFPYQTKASWHSMATALTSAVKCVRQVLINLVCYTITSAGMGIPHDRCHSKAQDWMFSLNCIGFPCYLFSHTEMCQNYISHSIKAYTFHERKEIIIRSIHTGWLQTISATLMLILHCTILDFKKSFSLNKFKRNKHSTFLWMLNLKSLICDFIASCKIDVDLEFIIWLVSCQKGPTRHAYVWQIGPFWQDNLNM